MTNFITKGKIKNNKPYFLVSSFNMHWTTPHQLQVCIVKAQMCALANQKGCYIYILIKEQWALVCNLYPTVEMMNTDMKG